MLEEYSKKEREQKEWREEVSSWRSFMMTSKIFASEQVNYRGRWKEKGMKRLIKTAKEGIWASGGDVEEAERRERDQRERGRKWGRSVKERPAMKKTETLIKAIPQNHDLLNAWKENLWKTSGGGWRKKVRGDLLWRWRRSKWKCWHEAETTSRGVKIKEERVNNKLMWL